MVISFFRFVVLSLCPCAAPVHTPCAFCAASPLVHAMRETSLTLVDLVSGDWLSFWRCLVGWLPYLRIADATSRCCVPPSVALCRQRALAPCLCSLVMISLASRTFAGSRVGNVAASGRSGTSSARVPPRAAHSFDYSTYSVCLKSQY